jgi:hypothetical protein
MVRSPVHSLVLVELETKQPRTALVRELPLEMQQETRNLRKTEKK